MTHTSLLWGDSNVSAGNISERRKCNVRVAPLHDPRSKIRIFVYQDPCSLQMREAPPALRASPIEPFSPTQAGRREPAWKLSGDTRLSCDLDREEGDGRDECSTAVEEL